MSSLFLSLSPCLSVSRVKAPQRVNRTMRELKYLPSTVWISSLFTQQFCPIEPKNYSNLNGFWWLNFLGFHQPLHFNWFDRHIKLFTQHKSASSMQMWITCNLYSVSCYWVIQLCTVKIMPSNATANHKYNKIWRMWPIADMERAQLLRWAFMILFNSIKMKMKLN